MTLLDVVQQIVKSCLDSAQLTDMAVGTVTSASPLEITIDVQQAALREEVLIVLDPVESSSDFPTISGVLNCRWGSSSFSVGDKVLLLSVLHGQKYLVISRL